MDESTKTFWRGFWVAFGVFAATLVGLALTYLGPPVAHPVDPPPVVVNPPPTPIPNTTWQAYVAARAARPDAYADSGQWDCLMFEATGDAAYAKAAIAQALGNWPNLADSNNSREHAQEAALLYEKLKTHMTAEQRATWEANLRTWAELMLGREAEGDSDEVTSHYFGLRLIDRAIGSDYCSRTDTAITAPRMRELITEFVAKAKGGEWIESSMYNQGTVSLLLLGVRQLGPAEFPEVIAWLPELAESMVWSVTADGRDTTQWGDEQNPHNAKLYAWVALACQVIELGGDKTGQLAHLVAARIKDRPVDDYGFNLHRVLWAGFDPDALPANPVWPNPQGLRVTNVGLIIYRNGDTLAACFLPSQLYVDHQIDRTNIRLYDAGEWLIDSPIGYGDPHPINEAQGFGFGAMFGRQLVSAVETADGFKAVWTTGGSCRGPWADKGNDHPRTFVEEMTTTIEYTHTTRSFRLVDTFKGREPDLAQMGGPGFNSVEREIITTAPARWQRIQHMPTEPQFTSKPAPTDSFRHEVTWMVGDRRMVLTTTARTMFKEKCNGVNMRGNYHADQLEGWFVRLMSDELPAARIETTVGLGAP